MLGINLLERNVKGRHCPHLSVLILYQIMLRIIEPQKDDLTDAANIVLAY